MGFLAIVKFFIPIFIDGIKEIIIPKEHSDTARLSIGIRVCILVILLFCLLLGFVTDKLYIVHTSKVQSDAQVTILQERLIECREDLEAKCSAPPPPLVIKSPPLIPDPFEHRNKIIDDINLP